MNWNTSWKNGFASDREEMRIGVCRIAAPVYDKAGRVAACIGIAAPAFRIQVSDGERIGPIVRHQLACTGRG